MSVEPFCVQVPRRLAGVRFDRGLEELLPSRSRAQLQKLVRRGRVKLNGRKVLRSNFALRGGEELIVRLEESEPAHRAQLDLLHVHEDWIVVNKPAGMLVHPTRTRAGATVAELAVQRFGPLPSVEARGDEATRPGIVHRLDRDTSGVLVLARSEAALEGLRRQFRERTVDKCYTALVYGVPREPTFRVDKALGAAPGQRDLQRLVDRGRPATSSFRVVRSWERIALVECRPETGRRHQLRVHLASVGHPVVGDALYRPADSVERWRGMRGHALHARSLAFDCPTEGTRRSFEAPMPARMSAMIDALDAARP